MFSVFLEICASYLFTLPLPLDLHRQLSFTTRLSATKAIQIYSLQGNYLQLYKVD